MADTKLTGLTATTTPVLTDETYIVTTPGGTPASHYVTLEVLQQLLVPKTISDGRLTLTTGTPVTTADVTNATTVYYTPYRGNKIGLYDGTTWHVRTFAEISIAVGAFTASKPYDIWVYDNSGTPALDSTVWTNATTRATALAYQDGVLIKSGAATRRYVGTIYIDSGQKCQDTTIQRFVWNYYNRVGRLIYKADVTNHTYAVSSVRYWNNDNTQNIYYVAGLVEDTMQLGLGLASTDAIGQIGCDQDSATTFDRTLPGAGATTGGENIGYVSVLPLLGYHYISVIEYAASSTTFYEYQLSGNILG